MLLLIIEFLSMRKLLLAAAEKLLVIVMRRYKRDSTLITSNSHAIKFEYPGESEQRSLPVSSAKK